MFGWNFAVGRTGLGFAAGRRGSGLVSLACKTEVGADIVLLVIQGFNANNDYYWNRS